jgi:cytochrome P450
MSVPLTPNCLFAPGHRPLDAPDPERARLHETGPLVELEGPAGGPVRVVTDVELARAVLTDARIVKDPALAPPGWDRRTAGLEPTAAEQMSLTTLDGPGHDALRKAFAPLFSAGAMRDAYGRMTGIARRLLADVSGAEVDLMTDFTTRYPVTVLCDLLGIPAGHIDEGIAACRLMHVDYPAQVGPAMAGFAKLAHAALDAGGGIATTLAGRMPAGSTAADLEYQIFTLLYAGQLTTDPAIGFLIATLLHEPGNADAAEVVRRTLTRHPPAPFSLWRFTAVDIEIAATAIPARTPILIDIEGINERLGSAGHDLSFGFGPHYCIGAQLARLELQALTETIVRDYPRARLAVPYEDLRFARPGGILGGRIVSLPVSLG